MLTQIVTADDPSALPRALAYLKSGELVAFPTDTVYGLGTSAFNPLSIDKLFVVKGRDTAKAIAVLIGEPSALKQVAAKMTGVAEQLAERFWPGPLTLVVPRHPNLPDNLSPLSTIGVRMPNHPVSLELLRQSGPLAVTSANLSGQPSTITARQVSSQLSGRLPLIIDGGQTPGGQPSTVVDCTGSELVILRSGPLSLHDLKSALA